MTQDEKNQYVEIYTQKQEQLIVQYLRKSIDDEIKLLMLNSSVVQLNNTIKEWEAKYEESQRNVASQNEIMAQATRSIEDLTNKTKSQQDHINNLNRSLSESQDKINNIQNDINKANKARDDALNEMNLIKSSIDQYKNEINRQNEELQSLFKENEELKLGINNKKPILKKKDDTF
jgi:chromosome segregation ATPase